MKKETKNILLANGTWMAIGLAIGVFFGGVFVYEVLKVIGALVF